MLSARIFSGPYCLRSRFIITLTFSWSGFTAWMEHGIGIGLGLGGMGMGMGMGYSMKICDIQSLLSIGNLRTYSNIFTLATSVFLAHGSNAGVFA